MQKIGLILLLVLGLAAVGAAGYFGFQSSPSQAAPPTQAAPKTVAVTTCDVEQSVTAPGKLINTNEITLEMPTSGRLSEINVRAGDVVHAGQVLAQLDAVARTEAQLKLLAAKKAVEVATNIREGMKYPRATADYLKKLQAKIDLAKDNVAVAADAYRRAQDAVVKNQALLLLSNAQDEYDKQVATYNWYTGKANDADFDEANAKLAQARAERDAAKALVASMEIKAPFNGVVLEVKVRPGESIAGGAGILVINDPQAVELETEVVEEDLPLMGKGQAASLYFDALPDATLTGQVSRIVPDSISGDRPLYHVYIKLDNVPDKLAAGMSADASIVIAGHKGVLCLPRAVIRASAGDTVSVKVWDGGRSVSRQIKVGLRGDASIEILEGLKLGDLVVTK